MSASAKSRMLCPSGTDSPSWSRTKGRKTVVVVVVVVMLIFKNEKLVSEVVHVNVKLHGRFKTDL